MRNPTPVLSWLRLVQAARNADEQNTEAFLKAGQLYVRTIRDIRQEEELLVWYDHELSHLLGFREQSRGLSDGERSFVRAAGSSGSELLQYIWGWKIIMCEIF